METDLNARTVELSQLKGTVRFHEGVYEYHKQMFEHFAEILAERIKEEAKPPRKVAKHRDDLKTLDKV
jgi:hypothetical protein